MLTGWSQPATLLRIGPNAVQLWRLNLGTGTGRVETNRLSSVLSEAEKQRASAMRVDSVRAEFVAARWLVRQLLGRTLEIDPKAIELATGTNGKPCLQSTAGIEFNLSHSRGLIMVGVSTSGAIGVDVEFIDSAFVRSSEMLAIARDTLPPTDVLAIESASVGRERDLAFYGAWTRHEAVLKADGRGIAEPLEAQTCGPFQVREVDAGEAHCAALATTPAQSGTVLLDANEVFARA